MSRIGRKTFPMSVCADYKSKTAFLILGSMSSEKCVAVAATVAHFVRSQSHRISTMMVTNDDDDVAVHDDNDNGLLKIFLNDLNSIRSIKIA